MRRRENTFIPQMILSLHHHPTGFLFPLHRHRRHQVSLLLLPPLPSQSTFSGKFVGLCRCWDTKTTPLKAKQINWETRYLALKALICDKVFLVAAVFLRPYFMYSPFFSSVFGSTNMHAWSWRISEMTKSVELMKD